jgi:hypothetical protein
MMMILASVLCECIPVFGLVIHTINSSFGQLVEVSSQHRTHIFRTDPHPYPINFGPVDVFCSLHRLSLFRIGDTIFGFMALLSIVTNTRASCPFLCSIAVISSSAPICHGAVLVGVCISLRILACVSFPSGALPPTAGQCSSSMIAIPLFYTHMNPYLGTTRTLESQTTPQM